MEKKGTTLGATLLVAGTCIGGGMLALPLATGEAGFFPSLIMMLLGWAFMTLTALYLSEVNLWMGEGSHVISMASRFLGPVGKGAAWLLFLFMSYASLVAYTAGGSQLFQKAVEKCCGIHLGDTVSAIAFVFIFGLIIYLGNIILGRINTLLMIGLIVSYALLVGSGVFHINAQNLVRVYFGKIYLAVPLLLTIFSFQTIIPSLTIYLKQDGKALRLSIILGTTISLIVYVVWQLVVLGTVPYEGGLEPALTQGTLSTECLGLATNNLWICRFADFFAFFAIITSFLGMGLGLFDFLADGLHINRKKRWPKLYLGLLVAIPTLFFALSIEHVFLKALDATGGIGDALLNGIIPCLMVWVGRYSKKLKSEFRVPGGRPLIVIAIGYALFVFAVELIKHFKAAFFI